MASIQEIIEYPLVSLPENYQLVVISFEDEATQKKDILILGLQSTEEEEAKNKTNNKINTLQIPKSDRIKVVLSVKESVIRFNDVFSNVTQKDYQKLSLSSRFAEAFKRFGRIFKNKETMIKYIVDLSQDFIVYLLNVKHLGIYYSEITIKEEVLESYYEDPSIRVQSLCNVAKMYCNQIILTNISVYEFLDSAKGDNATTLHWAINDLQMMHEMEEVAKKNFFNILNETGTIPDQSRTLIQLISQLFVDLDEVQESKLAYRNIKLYHLMNSPFLPVLDEKQKVLNSAIKERIFMLNKYKSHVKFLDNFVATLEKEFVPSYVPNDEAITSNLNELDD